MIPKASSFEFVSVVYEEAAHSIVCQYKTVLKEGDVLSFEERIILPPSLLIPLDKEKRSVFDRLLHNIHLILGISYWKLHCAPDIIVSSCSLSKQQAAFWNTIYSTGLGEFYYRNNILPIPHISFPYKQDHVIKPYALSTKKHALVGIGGGKDSLVSVELLKKQSYPFQGFAVEQKNQTTLVDTLAPLIGCDIVSFQRVLDPQLSTLTDVYTGHVPISAVYAFLGVLACVLTDSQYFIVSNEHSANQENVWYNGVQINHQWSKSLAFEELFRSYIHSFITPDITYFSLLRPFHEIAVVKEFTAYPQYFQAFSSCNRNFKMQKDHDTKGLFWCGACPKCAFAFVMLAAFLPRETILGIFKTDMFKNAQLIPLYQELLGIQGIKPWDCVGTFEETRLAFYLAHERGEWEETPVMNMFVHNVLPSLHNVKELKKRLFEADKKSMQKVPKEFSLYPS